MGEFLLIFLLSLVALYVVVILIATYVSVHPPRVPLWLSPAMLGFPQEDVTIDSGGLMLTGWWSNRGSGHLVIVCCHGYLMNRCELLPFIVTLADLKASWLFFDFRCHGKSGGRLCTMGRNEAGDVAAAVRFVRSRCPDAKVLLFGSSMGGSASAIAVGNDPELVDGLILDGAYSSMDEAGRGWWDFLGGKVAAILLRPTLWIGRLYVGFNPAKVVIADYLQLAQHRPVLFLGGDDDPVVPIASLEKNVAASGDLTWVERFEGCGHGEARFREPERYVSAIRRFVREALRGVGP